MADEERTVYHHLLNTDDAMVWATEFCRIFDGWVVRQHTWADLDHEINEGTMVAWFANAIETAKSIEREKTDKVAEAYIEATNPGIDMDEVRRLRSSDE